MVYVLLDHNEIYMGDLGERTKNTIIGFAIGVASILPGISGGIMAVLFGVYERLIEDLALLRTRIRTDFWFIFTIGVGLVIGMVAATFGVGFLIDNFYMFSMFMFVGMIMGQLPEVYGISREDAPKIKPVHIVCFIIGTIVMLTLMFFDKGGTESLTDHTITSAILLFASGAIIAISKAVPGISGSSLLLALGLYVLTIDAVRDFDIFLILFLGLGVIVGLLVFAKIMDALIKKYRAPTYFAILGLTFGSIFVIVDEIIKEVGDFSVGDVGIGVIAVVVGVVISLALNVYCRRYRVCEEPVAA